MITDPKVEQYLLPLIPGRSPLFQRLEREAREEGIPIIQLPSAQFLRILMLSHKPRRILEIGTAIGYSAIWLAEAAPEARVVTMEIDPARAERARANVAEAGLAERIRIVVGDARDGLPADEAEPFDVLFIDAAKGQYQAFLDRYLPHVREGGLIVSDNVLFRGWVADPALADDRGRAIAEKIGRYNRYLAEHPALVTSFVPIGDGVAVSVKHSRVWIPTERVSTSIHGNANRLNVSSERNERP